MIAETTVNEEIMMSNDEKCIKYCWVNGWVMLNDVLVNTY